MKFGGKGSLPTGALQPRVLGQIDSTKLFMGLFHWYSNCAAGCCTIVPRRKEQPHARLARLLDQPSNELFGRLLSHGRGTSGALSSREKRALSRELEAKLAAAGLDNAQHKANLLLELNAHAHYADYLLRHPEYEFIKSTAMNLAAIISSSDNMHSAVERVSRIVLALKGFANHGAPGEMSRVDIGQALDSVLAVYQGQIKRGIELLVEREPVPLLICLPEDMKQLWAHLIHNALQEMDYKGKLSIGIWHIGGKVQQNIQMATEATGQGVSQRVCYPHQLRAAPQRDCHCQQPASLAN